MSATTSIRLRVATAAAIALAGALALALVPPPARSPAGAGLPGGFEQVAHDPLGARGLNSTVAIAPRYAYAGSFADSSRDDSGVQVVDIHDPRHPRKSGEIPARGGLAPIELRVWRRERLLFVLNDRCRPPACPNGSAAQPDLSVYDISGPRGAKPRLVARRPISPDPHEMYLWQDPRRPGRALLYVSTPVGVGPNVVALDVSRAERGNVRRLGTWAIPAAAGARYGVHSVSVSEDGRRAFLSAYDLGYLMLSTADFAADLPRPRFEQLTSFDDRLTYEGVNGHSWVEAPGRPFAVTADEISGCPWSRIRVVDVSDPTRPREASSIGVPPYNDPEQCATVSPTDPSTGLPTQSFSAHDPTLTCRMAIVSWFGAGVQAFSLRDPRAPRRVGEFRPDPLPAVAAEHPHLQGIAMHSYPIFQDGLIYVLDIRNGLYVLRYHGPDERELSRIGFLEGNSNLSRRDC